MRKVSRDEILDLGAYEAIRPHFRARVIEEKRARRVALGDRMTVIFENHDTILLQIQEMLRTERITRPGAIDHEIETYNTLLGGEMDLAATAFVEIDDPVERSAFLERAIGLEHAFSIEIDGSRFSAEPDPASVSDERAVAVIYLRFPLDEAARAPMKGGAAKVRLAVDHEAYRAETELGPATVRSLAEDLES